MPNQSGKNVLVAYKVEATFNTPPGTGGGKVLRIAGGGLGLQRALINSEEIRSDGQSSIARLGSRSVPGGYNGELSVGSFEDFFEAVMRSTWAASFSVTSTGAGAFIDLTVNANNQMTRTGSGSFLTDGFRVGDIIRLTNYSQVADNNINLRIKALTATVITVHGTPLTTGAADTSVTVTCLKKLKRAATPTKRSFQIEENDIDIDASETFGGCRIVGFKITGSPDGMAKVEWMILGASATPLTGASAPYYTSPTLPTGIPLVFADAVISYAGADIAIATAFELNYLITAKTEPVIGSSVSPDVFDNDAQINGSLSLIRQDLAALTALSAETEIELHILLTEPEAEPKDCLAFYVPRLKVAADDNPLGGDGAMIDGISWTAGMKEGAGATGYDDTMLTISTSAP